MHTDQTGKVYLNIVGILGAEPSRIRDALAVTGVFAGACAFWGFASIADCTRKEQGR